MRLYVGPMDSVVVEVDDEGRVRLENEKDLTLPTLQERRAIIYAAKNEVQELEELIQKLESGS